MPHSPEPHSWPTEHRRTHAQEIINATEFDLDPADVLILKAMSHGLFAGEAAEVLGWPGPSVYSRVKLMRTKLKAKHDAHLIATALRLKIIS